MTPSIPDVPHFFRLLAGIDWIAAAGRPVEGSHAQARVLASWAEVEWIATDDASERYLDAAAREIAVRAVVNARGALRMSDVYGMDTFGPEAVDLVSRKLASTPSGGDVPHYVRGRLNWIIMHAAREIHFRSYAAGSLFQSLALWLLRGHLPLAWEAGAYPKGRAVVY